MEDKILMLKINVENAIINLALPNKKDDFK
jgi:hypothetical protein